MPHLVHPYSKEREESWAFFLCEFFVGLSFVTRQHTWAMGAGSGGVYPWAEVLKPTHPPNALTDPPPIDKFLNFPRLPSP